MAFNNAITALGRILKRKGSPDDDSGGGQENNDRAATKKFCSSSSSLAAAALRDISAPSIDHFLTCGLDGNRRRQHPNDAIEEQGSRWIKQIQRFDFSLSSSLTPPSAVSRIVAIFQIHLFPAQLILLCCILLFSAGRRRPV